MRARIVAAVAFIVLCSAVPGAVAAGLFPDAHSDVQIQWQKLFTDVFWAATIVFVLVEGLLFYAMLRFRRRKDGPQEGPHIHGNTKMEIAWTIAPTLVMAWLLVVSLDGIALTDDPPNADFEITVTGSRFVWKFTYPDDSVTYDRLFVEAGKTVSLLIVSTDVIHAFNVPSLGVMMDAVPGHNNRAWMRANEPGEYFAQCRELCGAGHGVMRASVVAFAPGTYNSSFGDPARLDAPPATTTPASGNGTANTTAPQGDETLKVNLNAGFRIDPATNVATPGKKLVIEVTNKDSSVHNLFVGEKRDVAAPERGALWKTANIDPGQAAFLEIPLPTEPGFWTIWCDISGHFDQGMKGTLSTGGTSKDTGGPKPLLPGFELPLLFGALAAAGILIRRRRN